MNHRAAPCASLPLVWDDAERHAAARPALASILHSARRIGEAECGCIVLLREADALEVVCAHGLERAEFLEIFGEGARPCSLVSLPFTQGLRQRGALFLFRLRTPQLSEFDLQLLEGLAAQAELALALAQQQCAIERLQATLQTPGEPLLITGVVAGATQHTLTLQVRERA